MKLWYAYFSHWLYYHLLPSVLECVIIMYILTHLICWIRIWCERWECRQGGTFVVKTALRTPNSRGNSGTLYFENAELIPSRRSWLQPTEERKKKQSRVTSVCNNSPIPLDQKHLKLLCWIKIEFSLLSYSPYHQQCIIPARSAGSCRSGLQRFTSQYLCFGKCWLGDCSDWVNVKD